MLNKPFIETPYRYLASSVDLVGFVDSIGEDEFEGGGVGRDVYFNLGPRLREKEGGKEKLVKYSSFSLIKSREVGRLGAWDVFFGEVGWKVEEVERWRLKEQGGREGVGNGA